MWFVCLSIVWFALWIGLRVEHYPFGLLTMIVSLDDHPVDVRDELAGHSADEKRQVLADNQWKIVQTEEAQNEQLIRAIRADPGAHEGDPRAHGARSEDARGQRDLIARYI